MFRAIPTWLLAGLVGAAGAAHAGEVRTFGSVAIERAGAYSEYIQTRGTGDLDGDGVDEIVLLGAAFNPVDGGYAYGVDLYRTSPDGPELIGSMQILASILSNSGFDHDDVFVGDFDGDGVPDLAALLGTANFDDKTDEGLYVWWGVGGLGFAGPEHVETADGIARACVVNLDGDDRDELLFAVSKHTLQVVRPEPGGGLTEVWTSPFDDYVYDLAPADFDGDGAVDVAIGGTELRIYRGVGDGTLETDPWVTIDHSADDLAPCDFDLDGRMDLACTLGAVTVLRNAGGGVFEAYPHELLPYGVVRSIRAHDFDGNALPDVLVTYSNTYQATNEPVVLTNPLSAIAADRAEIWPGVGGGAFMAYDLGGDGVWDILGVHPDEPGWSIARNRGGDVREEIFGVQAINRSGSTYHALVRDFDMDGVEDVLLSGRSNTNGDVQILRTSPGGVLADTMMSYVRGESYFFASVQADVNRDGLLDFASVSDDGKLYVFENGPPAGSFGDPIVIDTGLTDGRGLARGNFDGDGYQGFIACGLDSGDVAVVENAGGVLGEPRLVPAGDRLFTVASADFDEDGLSDAAAVEWGQPLARILLSSGPSGLALASTLDLPDEAYWVRAKDLNDDGHADLLFTHQWLDTISVYLGDGAGGFTGPIESVCGPYVIEADLRDVDGDGVIDVALARLDQRTSSINHRMIDSVVLRGRGDGSFVEWARLPATRATTIGLGDVTGDGLVDVVSVDDGAARDIFVYEQMVVDVPCAADLTGDGVLDLDDIDAFAQAFIAGDLATDLDGNSVLNLDDVNVFAASFIAGCP